MRGAGGGGADAAGVGALTPSMKVYVAPFIQLLQYSTTYCILYCIYTVNGATVQYSSATSTVLYYSIGSLSSMSNVQHLCKCQVGIGVFLRFPCYGGESETSPHVGVGVG